MKRERDGEVEYIWEKVVLSGAMDKEIEVAEKWSDSIVYSDVVCISVWWECLLL